MAKKTIVSTTKKSAKIVSMATAMAVGMGLSGEDVKATQAAFEDMAEEYGEKAIIVALNPFDGFCA